jgi:hypothetical protein
VDLAEVREAVQSLVLFQQQVEAGEETALLEEPLPEETGGLVVVVLLIVFQEEMAPLGRDLTGARDLVVIMAVAEVPKVREETLQGLAGMEVLENLLLSQAQELQGLLVAVEMLAERMEPLTEGMGEMALVDQVAVAPEVLE